jgi:uncharacterized protein YegJ (DUF2314 family)
MKEDPRNVRYVCPECTEVKKKEAQRNLPPLSDLVGKYVKKAFNEKGKRTEHMWVKVSSVNEKAGTLVGVLDNDPTMVSNVVCGDKVIVYANEIEEII